MDLNDASTRVIADLLAERTGQQLTEARLWRVPSALGGVFRQRGIANVEQLACLLADPRDRTLADEVVEALLNNETYFFRDTASFAAIDGVVLNDLAEKRANIRHLNIWSAGCSTGQETLSLAMLFAQQPERWNDWTFTIVGTDVSQAAIQSARQATYSQFEIQRGISVSQMLAFFDEKDGQWQADERIRSMVRFQRHNILETPPRPGQFDLVLCRNVLLYFDGATRSRVFETLHRALANDGWLMLGAGETVVGQTECFFPAPNGASVFQPGTATARMGAMAGHRRSRFAAA